jgi:hypothetical protein
MRDWALVVAPVAAVLYFLFEPGQFNALVGLLERVLQ